MNFSNTRINGIIVLTALAMIVSGGCSHSEPSSKAQSTEIAVAVASNFAEPIKIIAQNFEKKTGYQVILSYGSTGRHYAQIKNGAPFEAFLAADSRRPELLEEEGLIVSGSRFTYAIGQLALWSAQAEIVDSGGAVLDTINDSHLALANPRLAPYGRAAQQVLEALGHWDRLQDRIVQGENIGQTYQFVKSGTARLGFVAVSQIMRPGEPLEGSHWMIPKDLYSPIEQQAVLIKDNATARAFLEYLKSSEVLEIIRDYGYDTPQSLEDDYDTQ